MQFNEAQLAILKDESNYIQVIAGAGAGKTSTMIGILDHSIRHGKFSQESCLVLTFSRKATHEFQERLNLIQPNNRIRIQTFHAYCLSVLKKYSPNFTYFPPEILSENEKEDFFRIFFTKHRFKVGGIPYKYLIQEENPYLPIIDKDLWNLAKSELDQYKKDNRKLEFSDLVRDYLQALKEKKDWTIQPKLESRFIIVDEFQDTDFQQLEFLCEMSPDKLIVVGDDWQAIYGFRGATPQPFLELNRYFSPLKKHFLTVNYRSLPKIVEVSQIPIHKNAIYIPKKMKSQREGNSDLGLILLPEGRLGVEIVSTSILKAIEKESNVKVLCRTNFRITEFKLCGIPDENLMTIHASKGLEFNHVYVDLHDGWNHNPSQLTVDTKDEERRILYVALSRAKNSLHILGKSSLKPEKRLEDEFFQYFSKMKIPKSLLKAA